MVRKNSEAVRESVSYIVSHKRLNKEQVEVTLRHSDGSNETMFSWKAWWKHESAMTSYVKQKKLRGRLFNRNEEDDQVIEEIVGFDKKHRLKSKTTYVVVWDTGNIQKGVSHQCLSSDASEVLAQFWKGQQAK